MFRLATFSLLVVILTSPVNAQTKNRQIPDMSIPIWSAEQLREQRVALDEIERIEEKIEQMESRGEDATHLKELASEIKKEHLDHYLEAENVAEADRLRHTVLIPRMDYLNELIPIESTEPVSPEQASQLIDELYVDMGLPLTNLSYLMGAVLPLVDYLSWRELAPETRSVLRNGLVEYGEAVMSSPGHPIPDPGYQAELGEVLYRLSDVNDDQALELARTLIYDGLAYAEQLGREDDRLQIQTRIAIIFEPENALSASQGQPAHDEDIKKARQLFRKGIRNPSDPTLARQLLGFVLKQWQRDATNEEMVRSFLTYAAKAVYIAHHPPRVINEDNMRKVIALVNKGMVHILGKKLSLRLWNKWRSVAVRMRGLASNDLKLATRKRLQVLQQLRDTSGLDSTQGFVLKYLVEVKGAIGEPPGIPVNKKSGGVP